MLASMGDCELALFLPQRLSSLLKGTNKLEPNKAITLRIKDLLLYSVPCAVNQRIELKGPKGPGQKSQGRVRL